LKNPEFSSFGSYRLIGTSMSSSTFDVNPSRGDYC